jgi:Mn-dependent DtxR family transcriptional regulator
LRPDLTQFLKKIFDLTKGELRIINQYEVGERLELTSKQTDKIVYELSNSGMIKSVARNKIVLSPHALYVMNNSKNLD